MTYKIVINTSVILDIVLVCINLANVASVILCSLVSVPAYPVRWRPVLYALVSVAAYPVRWRPVVYALVSVAACPVRWREKVFTFLKRQ